MNILAVCYVNIIRGTPLLVQIFLIYFALPMIIGERINPFVAAVAACSVNSGAYVAEIFRAGIQSVDKGQMEAGRSLGLSWMQTMRYIICLRRSNTSFRRWAMNLFSMTKENVPGFGHRL